MRRKRREKEKEKKEERWHHSRGMGRGPGSVSYGDYSFRRLGLEKKGGQKKDVAPSAAL